MSDTMETPMVLCGETPIEDEDILAGFRLDGRRAVVTGASRGLGKRMARVLHAAGASVVVAARRENLLQDLCDQLGERALPVQCDVSNEADRARLMERTVSELGGVDILINDAGALDVVPSEDEELAQFRTVIETNLVATFHLCQLAARSMLPSGGGSIINIASILGLVAGTPFSCAGYTASKGGVINLTRELGVQWAPRGVRVNAIAPGYFPTDMTKYALQNPETVAYLTSNTPMGRLGLDHELDTAVLFLAGSGSSYITGQTIAVDGGWTVR
jgi:NAD(P)-dependent dehydrogenase (short-subunit alcohol dehydrogenase family)